MGVKVNGATATGSAGWMQKGTQASQEMAKQAAAETAARAAMQGKMWQFWLKDGEECQITFVDGALDDEGFFAPLRYYEHTVKTGNKIDNYVCPEKSNPALGQTCPLCEEGNRAYLVAVFTVIDHREFESTKTPGKVFKDSPKLLKAKPQSADYLAKIAQKRGGLAGITFDVSRHGEKSAAIGSHYDFVSKEENLEALEKKYTRTYKDDKGKDVTETVFKPADYDTEISFLSEDDLRALGFGKGVAGGMKATTTAAKSQNYDDQL